MDVLYRYSRSPGIVETIHGLHLKHKHRGAVEDGNKDEHREDTHQRDVAEVAFTVVSRSKASVRECAAKLALHVVDREGEVRTKGEREGERERCVRES